MFGRQPDQVYGLHPRRYFIMKRTLTAVVLLVLALWIGYNLGRQEGVQEERRAWLATEQSAADTLPIPSVDADGRVRQRPHIETRTLYTYPHSGGMVYSGPNMAPVNTPDPRTLRASDSPSPISEQAVCGGLPAQTSLRASFPWVGKSAFVGFS
jgi:hypothetical protein